MTHMDLYSKMQYRFPLIAAVLEGRQRGVVWANSTDNPTHFFVVNNFGFCQEFFSLFDTDFFRQILEYINSTERPKLRMYAPLPHMEEFLRSTNFASKAERCQYLVLGGVPEQSIVDSRLFIRDFTVNDLCRTDFGLALTSRYWDGEEDFLRNTVAVGAFDGDIPVGIWYAACVAMGRAEMDAFVADEYRKRGLGLRMALGFIARCRERGLVPSWDCYSNNEPSMRLAKKIGCELSFSYAFYNIGSPGRNN